MNLTEEEDGNTMGYDIPCGKVFNFLYKNECVMKFKKDLHATIFKDDQELLSITFSDLYYPKNLLKHLEERIKCSTTNIT